MHIIPYEPHNKNQSGGYMVEAILMDEGAHREKELDAKGVRGRRRTVDETGNRKK